VEPRNGGRFLAALPSVDKQLPGPADRVCVGEEHPARVGELRPNAEETFECHARALCASRLRQLFGHGFRNAGDTEKPWKNGRSTTSGSVE
jgi:hypothetical protein